MKLFIETDQEHLQRGIPTDEDDKLLQLACWQRDIHAQVFAWNDERVHLEEADAVIVRSTWTYHHTLQEFLIWTRRVAQIRPLWNHAEIIAWNSHKHYLQELNSAGIKTIPTIWLDKGRHLDVERVITEILAHWPHIVIKPTPSSNAHATLLTRDAATAQKHIFGLLPHRDVMVQPYIPAVQDIGEHSHVFIEGIYAHSFRKKAVLATDDKGEIPAEPSHEERAVAQNVLKYVAHRFSLPATEILFARVDLVPIGREFHVMELELIEPRLRLDIHNYQTLTWLAQAIERRLEALMGKREQQHNYSTIS